MSKYLILYRHGLPEDKTKVANDDLRGLSIRGKTLLKKSIFGFNIMLGKKKKVLIFSSPMARAVQTATMLSSELNLESPQYLDFLATGGNIKLVREIVNNLEPSSVAVIVGHSPYLSVWNQQLSGIYLPFKKGSASCLKFPNKGAESAELRWFLQTRDFIKISGK